MSCWSVSVLCGVLRTALAAVPDVVLAFGDGDDVVAALGGWLPGSGCARWSGAVGLGDDLRRGLRRCQWPNRDRYWLFVAYVGSGAFSRFSRWATVTASLLGWVGGCLALVAFARRVRRSGRRPVAGLTAFPVRWSAAVGPAFLALADDAVPGPGVPGPGEVTRRGSASRSGAGCRPWCP